MTLNKPLKAEILDQVLHFVSNVAIVLFFAKVVLLPDVAAALIALLYTLGREAYQHRKSRHCNDGCQRDIFFSVLGISFGVLLV